MAILGVIVLLIGIIVAFGAGFSIRNSLKRFKTESDDADFHELIRISSLTFKVIGLIVSGIGAIMILAGILLS